jgi:hypothetical protein
MIKALIPIFLLMTTSLFASQFPADGTYIGENTKTGGKCKIEIVMDGDYLVSRRAEYRITVHNKGPFIDCSDYQGTEFDGCASGEQVNGSQSRSLYLLLSNDFQIKKIYFQDDDNNSSNDRECINFRKI